MKDYQSSTFSMKFGLQKQEFYSMMCTKDERYRFVFLQGGTHYKTNASETIKHFLEPTLKKLVSLKISFIDLHIFYFLFLIRT